MTSTDDSKPRADKSSPFDQDAESRKDRHRSPSTELRLQVLLQTLLRCKPRNRSQTWSSHTRRSPLGRDNIMEPESQSTSFPATQDYTTQCDVRRRDLCSTANVHSSQQQSLKLKWLEPTRINREQAETQEKKTTTKKKNTTKKEVQRGTRKGKEEEKAKRKTKKRETQGRKPSAPRRKCSGDRAAWSRCLRFHASLVKPPALTASGVDPQAVCGPHTTPAATQRVAQRSVATAREDWLGAGRWSHRARVSGVQAEAGREGKDVKEDREEQGSWEEKVAFSNEQ